MSEIKKQFGKNLKHYRELKNLTQEQLAEKIEMNVRSLSFIECGTNFVTAKTLEKICKILEISPKQLFDFDYPAKQTQDLKNEITGLINTNIEKLNDIYKILKGFLS